MSLVIDMYNIYIQNMRALAGLISEQNNPGRPDLPAWRHVYDRGTAGRRNSAATEIEKKLAIIFSA